jgi:hypothetical protein
VRKFYNPKRSPLNTVLADGSPVLIGGHKSLRVDVISASIRRAVVKGLLVELIEPAVSATVSRSVEKNIVQPTVEESVQELPESSTEESLSAAVHDDTFSEDLVDGLEEVIAEEESSGDLESQGSQSDGLEELDKYSSRRKKKRGR